MTSIGSLTLMATAGYIWKAPWTMDSAFNIPVFPCTSIGWDDSPRFHANGARDVACSYNTPKSFGNFLQKAKEYVDAHSDQPRFMVINVWNEFVEGSYLLPDMLNGYGYLEAVRGVVKST